ncbi:phosphotyrosyl phosphate activator (ptpa) protein [Cardiosporidium cionae]|uniref:Serine/threonine-protein phosphatase 2A activator n=1 Tax=Cardiosporidium cionae TaxID=476202 RepID=A0ABQ7JEP5_9APIC|nr:phosphotyrosyl phosphate activator (ptpa) protein [Cardiosporidium cionae]|eukprot:KAF8822446.1 phosphotyrosyl phosphate activator (ptpa) protein [Cardiosporidium cionae]
MEGALEHKEEPIVELSPMERNKLQTESKASPSSYFRPVKRIQTEADFQCFLGSSSFTTLVNFIVDLGMHVKGLQVPKSGWATLSAKLPPPSSPEISVKETIDLKKTPMQHLDTEEERKNATVSMLVEEPARSPSPAILAIRNILFELHQSVPKFPPIKQAMRFGNRAFQNWWDHINENCSQLLKSNLPVAIHPAICELEAYLMESFGSRTRIDYGTGHEIAFCQFLFCLFKLNFLTEADKADCVLIVFKCYVELMRNIQILYKLEPAGSRGVWGLDDYHFLPFLWGAFQLQDQQHIKPNDVLNAQIVEEYAELYLYLNAIRFIFQTKHGVPFGECAPILYGITAVPTWTKIATGLIKMHQAEVLRKFPVAQHILFGSLYSFS